MPSVSGWALRPPEDKNRWLSRGLFLCPRFGLGFATDVEDQLLTVARRCFYALGFGLGFATPQQGRPRQALCAGVSMPSVSGWALRQHAFDQSRRQDEVSMPSVSGWALRPDRSAGGLLPLGFLCPRFRAGLCDDGDKIAAFFGAKDFV